MFCSNKGLTPEHHLSKFNTVELPWEPEVFSLARNADAMKASDDGAMKNKFLLAPPALPLWLASQLAQRKKTPLVQRVWWN